MRSVDWQRDIQYAITDAMEWAVCLQRSTTNNFSEGYQRCSGWTRHPQDFIKCNYDCRYIQNGADVRAAWVLRDSEGFYLGAAKSRGISCDTVLEAELQGLLMAMQHVWSRGYRKVVFEGDNNSVQKLVNGHLKNFGLHNLIREIGFWKRKFDDAVCSWTSRRCNNPADILARSQFPPNDSFILYDLVPHCITQA